MTASEKVAYIKGLIEGMELDTEKGQGKLLAAIADVLEDLALGLDDVENSKPDLTQFPTILKRSRSTFTTTTTMTTTITMRMRTTMTRTTDTIIP